MQRLDKDRTILETLARLDLESRGWAIEDHWDADLCAIGIRSASSDERLVYVSTFNEPEGRYYYECETHSDQAPLGYVVSDQGEGVTFEMLLATMRPHLDRTSS